MMLSCSAVLANNLQARPLPLLKAVTKCGEARVWPEAPTENQKTCDSDDHVFVDTARYVHGYINVYVVLVSLMTHFANVSQSPQT